MNRLINLIIFAGQMAAYSMKLAVWTLQKLVGIILPAPIPPQIDQSSNDDEDTHTQKALEHVGAILGKESEATLQADQELSGVGLAVVRKVSPYDQAKRFKRVLNTHLSGRQVLDTTLARLNPEHVELFNMMRDEDMENVVRLNDDKAQAWLSGAVVTGCRSLDAIAGRVRPILNREKLDHVLDNMKNAKLSKVEQP